MLQKLANILTGWTGGNVHPAEALRRQAICIPCPLNTGAPYQGLGWCVGCKCPLNKKTIVAAESCQPKGLW